MRGEEVKSWLLKEDPKQSYSWFETELMEGFFYDMHNSRGRIAINSLLEELFCVEENARAHNIGGSNTKQEPCVSQILKCHNLILYAMVNPHLGIQGPYIWSKLENSMHELPNLSILKLISIELTWPA